MFLTRLPIPKWVQHHDDYLQKTTRYFTLVGVLVGVLVGGAYMATSYLFSGSVATIVAMGISLLITGAFHEDGFADCCDAFGGGYSKEKILEIMKDSRLGTYGVAGLFFILFTKFLLLVELSGQAYSNQLVLVPLPSAFVFPVFIIAAYALSRFMPLLVIQYMPYVFQQDASKSKPLASAKPGWGNLSFALIISFVPFLFLPAHLLLVLLPMLVACILYAKYCSKKIGGYTGDCLGATQQITELVCYASIIVLLKFNLF
jgi:adenosylcobinamide-GDP ribazoletransferase